MHWPMRAYQMHVLTNESLPNACINQWEPTYAWVDPEEALVSNTVEELPEVSSWSLAGTVRPQLRSCIYNLVNGI